MEEIDKRNLNNHKAVEGDSIRTLHKIQVTKSGSTIWQRPTKSI